jgi:hypothetical protein
VQIGLLSLATRIDFIDWQELDADLVNYPDPHQQSFSKKIVGLFEFLEEKYLDGSITAEIDINNLANAANELNDKYEEMSFVLREKFDFWEGAERLKLEYQESFSMLFQELAKLPISAQCGLFRICSPRFADEEHFPALFALENIKPPEL